MSYLHLRQLVILAVLVGEEVDLLSQSAEGGAGEVQEVIDGAFDGEALLRAVDEGGLGGARILRLGARWPSHPSWSVSVPYQRPCLSQQCCGRAARGCTPGQHTFIRQHLS